VNLQRGQIWIRSGIKIRRSFLSHLTTANGLINDLEIERWIISYLSVNKGYDPSRQSNIASTTFFLLAI